MNFVRLTRGLPKPPFCYTIKAALKFENIAIILSEIRKRRIRDEKHKETEIQARGVY